MSEEKEKLERELLELLEAKEYELKYNKKSFMYPDSGPFRRELYPVHVGFMAAGDKFMERGFLAGNGTGKTTCGSFEMACHLTGEYPEWWEGRRFLNPITAWCVGVSNQQVKKVMQKGLLGKIHDLGSGMVPKRLLVGTPRMKPGVTDAIETFFVNHCSGGISDCTFMSGEQERTTFQGEDLDVIWMDEEIKEVGKYSECVSRLRNPIRPGIIYSTFTPLFGLSDISLGFFPGGSCPENGVNPEHPSRYSAQVSVYDVPHLTPEYIENIKKTYSPHEMDARLYGIPSLGAGAIYPYNTDSITYDNIPIEDWWPRGYGMDTKWNGTAALWGAENLDTGVLYIYAEHYMAEALPVIHASAIKRQGSWIRGVVDTSVLEPSAVDGSTLMNIYEEEGLELELADKSVEAGIFAVRQRLAEGRLKIAKSCTRVLMEYSMYRRDEKGKIVKKKDDLMDALRYLVYNWEQVKTHRPDPDKYSTSTVSEQTRDKITGY